MSELTPEHKVVEFFNTAECVQVEDGTWYYTESSVESELLQAYKRIAELKEQNSKLKMPIDLGDRKVLTNEQFNKIKADAVRQAAETFRIVNGASITDLLWYADKLEREGV